MAQRKWGREALWYGRLAIWVGAAILLIQAVLNRGAGPTSALGALVLAVGLAVFLAGLMGSAGDAATPAEAGKDTAPDGGPSKP